PGMFRRRICCHAIAGTVCGVSAPVGIPAPTVSTKAGPPLMFRGGSGDGPDTAGLRSAEKEIPDEDRHRHGDFVSPCSSLALTQGTAAPSSGVTERGEPHRGGKKSGSLTPEEAQRLENQEEIINEKRN